LVSKQDPDPYKKGLDPQTSCESETRIVDMDPLGSEKKSDKSFAC
jgi:hypothetical protein